MSAKLHVCACRIAFSWRQIKRKEAVFSRGIWARTPRLFPACQEHWLFLQKVFTCCCELVCAVIQTIPSASSRRAVDAICTRSNNYITQAGVGMTLGQSVFNAQVYFCFIKKQKLRSCSTCRVVKGKHYEVTWNPHGEATTQTAPGLPLPQQSHSYQATWDHICQHPNHLLDARCCNNQT